MYAGEGLELLDVLGYPAEQLNNSYIEKSVVLCMWVDNQSLHGKSDNIGGWILLQYSVACLFTSVKTVWFSKLGISTTHAEFTSVVTFDKLSFHLTLQPMILKHWTA